MHQTWTPTFGLGSCLSSAILGGDSFRQPSESIHIGKGGKGPHAHDQIMQCRVCDGAPSLVDNRDRYKPSDKDPRPGVSCRLGGTDAMQGEKDSGESRIQHDGIQEGDVTPVDTSQRGSSLREMVVRSCCSSWLLACDLAIALKSIMGGDSPLVETVPRQGVWNRIAYTLDMAEVGGVLGDEIEVPRLPWRDCAASILSEWFVVSEDME